MGLQSGGGHVALFLFVLSTFAAAVGALSLCVTVGSATAGKAAVAMNLVLLVSLVVGGARRGMQWQDGLLRMNRASRTAGLHAPLAGAQAGTRPANQGAAVCSPLLLLARSLRASQACS